MPPPEEREPDARFTLANERTFLAWNRTALTLVGGGLAAGQLLEIEGRLARLAIALPPIVLGAALALTSYGRWEANQRALRRGEPLPGTGPPRALALGIGLVAAVALVILVRDALR